MIDPLSVIIIGLLVIFLAGITQGLIGFGFAVVSVPLLILFLSPQIVVPIILIHGTLITVIILFESRKWVDLKRIWPLIIAGIAGTPLGTYLLIVLNVNLLKVLIGFIITLFSLALLKGLEKKFKNEKIACAPAGFISGLLNGSTTMSGPPVVLFFSNQGIKNKFSDQI